MPRNTLQQRFSQAPPPSVTSSPPGRTYQGSQPSQLPSSRGIKRLRPNSPFRVTPKRHLSSTGPFVHHGSSSTPSARTPNAGLAEEIASQIEDEDQEEEDGDKDIIMAVDYRGRRLGCSFYTEQDETLWFVNDVEVNMSGSSGGAAKEILESLRLQIQPTLILFPSRADDLFASSTNGNTLDNQPGVDLNIRPAPEFSVEQGRNKLAGLDLGVNEDCPTFITPNDANDMDADDEYGLGPMLDRVPGKKQSMLRLESYIDTEGSYVSVGCAGAVLINVRRRRAIQNPHAEDVPYQYGVSKLKLWTMENIM
ncbi:MutS protein msh5 [Orbilia javanica]|uniref:MutS protein msh5 n=1 Tax=Orbilia javanica TaxID=47235 RepID=A0AAN8RRA7_9PEZI